MELAGLSQVVHCALALARFGAAVNVLSPEEPEATTHGATHTEAKLAKQEVRPAYGELDS